MFLRTVYTHMRMSSITFAFLLLSTLMSLPPFSHLISALVFMMLSILLVIVTLTIGRETAAVALRAVNIPGNLIAEGLGVG